MDCSKPSKFREIQFSLSLKLTFSLILFPWLSNTNNSWLIIVLNSPNGGRRNSRLLNSRLPVLSSIIVLIMSATSLCHGQRKFQSSNLILICLCRLVLFFKTIYHVWFTTQFLILSLIVEFFYKVDNAIIGAKGNVWHGKWSLCRDLFYDGFSFSLEIIHPLGAFKQNIGFGLISLIIFIN